MLERESEKREWVAAALGQFAQPLVRYAARIVGNVDEARDVVQDTFLRLCAADRAEVDGRLAAWLYTVCRNRAIDVKRKERRMRLLWRARGKPTDSAPPSVASIDVHETHQEVIRLLGGLPENQQEVVRLKFQDALSYKEISEITGLSVSNVGYLLHTAIKTIRQRVAGPERLAEEAQGGIP